MLGKVSLISKDLLSKIIIVGHSGSKIIFIQREISRPKLTLVFVLVSKYLLRKRVVYDFDDGLFLASPFEINSIIRMSDVVIAGGHALLNYALPMNPRSFLVPTSVDASKYDQLRVESDDGKCVLGFIGSHHTIKHLEILREPLKMLAQKYDYTLRVVAAQKKSQYDKFPLFRKLVNSNVKVEFALWSIASEPLEMKKIDIGLAPLTNGAWENYKCGFKLINYMAANVPTVASAIGENNFIIQDGVNGYLCKNTKDWISKIGRLIENPELRRSLALNARRTVEEKYLLEKNERKLEQILINAFEET